MADAEVDSNDVKYHIISKLLDRVRIEFGAERYKLSERLLIRAKDLQNSQQIECYLGQVKLALETQPKYYDIQDEDMEAGSRNTDGCDQINDREEMMHNLFIIRAKLLAMEVNAVVDVNITDESLKFILHSIENIINIETYLHEAWLSHSFKNNEKANKILEQAEQEFFELRGKFPRKAKASSATPAGTSATDSNENKVSTDTSSASSHRAGVTVRGDLKAVLDSIKKAETAFNSGDLTKAEKWLLKAERMHHTSNAKELLDKVHAAMAAETASKAKPETKNEDQTKVQTEYPELSNIDNKEVRKCLDVADKAYRDGKFDKCERFLAKAVKFDAKINVDENLKALANARMKQQKSNKELEQSAATSSKSEADTYLEVARNALEAGDIDRAEKFVNISANIFCTEVTDELLTQICQAKLWREATNYLKDAVNAFKSGNLEVAETYLVKSETLFQGKNPETDSLRAEISIRKNFIKAERCIKSGEDAIKKRLIERAEFFLQQAIDLSFPNKELIRYLQNKISEAKNLALAEKYVKDAENAFEIGNIEDAVNLIDEASKLHSNVSYRVNSLRKKIKNYNEAINKILHAEKFIRDGDIKNAESLLEQADKLYHFNDERTNKLRARIMQSKDSRDKSKTSNTTYADTTKKQQVTSENKPSVCLSDGQFENCLKKAKEAIQAEELEKAEKLITKAERMCPHSVQVRKLRCEIRDLMSRNSKASKYHQTEDEHEHLEEPVNTKITGDTCVDNDQKLEAEKSIKVAEAALSSGDLKKAEKFLLKAERLWPTTEAQELLEKVHVEIEAIKSQERANTEDKPNENPSKPSKMYTNADDENNSLNECIKDVLQDIDCGRFHRARCTLIDAMKSYPDSDYIKDLLEQVRDLIKSNDPTNKHTASSSTQSDNWTIVSHGKSSKKQSTSHECRYNYKYESEQSNVKTKPGYAKRVTTEELTVTGNIAKAKAALEDKNYNLAEKYLTEKEMLLRESIVARSLYIAVLKAKYLPLHKAPNQKSDRDFESKTFLGIAENYFIIGDFDKAKKILMKADKLYSCNYSSFLLKLLKEINQSKCSII